MSWLRKRWQSIDRKLPLLASGLVVLTAAVLGTTSYALLERALVESAGRRLFATAKVVAQLAGRPMHRIGDSTHQADDNALRDYLLGRGSAARASDVLSRVAVGLDTQRFHAELLDAKGRSALLFHRHGGFEPRWPAAAIARGEIRGDTASLGPFENGGGVPIISLVRPIN